MCDEQFIFSLIFNIKFILFYFIFYRIPVGFISVIGSMLSRLMGAHQLRRKQRQSLNDICTTIKDFMVMTLR